MRQFTEKEIIGFARALQTYMRFANGQKATVKTYAALIERGLGQGLTIDEILNKENYSRSGRIIHNPTADEYIEMLSNRSIAVHDIREDEGWDGQENIKMLASCFHDFCLEFLPKGGNYLTANALENLRKGIMRYGIQTLMDEALIEEHKRRFEDDSKHTCFQYIINLLQNAEEMGVTQNREDNLSESQMARSSETVLDDDSGRNLREILPDDVSQEDKAEAERRSGESFNDEDRELETEPYGDESFDEMPAGDDGFSFQEIDDESDDYFSSSFNVNVNPREYKAQMIHELLLGFRFEEIAVLNEMIPTAGSLQELIDALAKGDYCKEKETLEARNIHQYMNTELIRPFIECVRIEGVEMDEAIASRYDILLDDWDLRDARTRKKDKIKNLIYQQLLTEDDPDLQSAISDIEDMYSKDR